MKCVIIEDELPAQRILKNYMAKLPDLQLINSYQSALEANSMLQNQQIDVVFLDINLPDISGLHYIKTLSNPPAIVITTAYPEHAVESFELDTICDYLVKPFSFERFLKAINKARKHWKRSSFQRDSVRKPAHALFLNVDKTLHKIEIDTILYIESDKNYVTVATRNGKLSYLESLKNWVETLPDSQFVQVHKSYIINYSEIDKIVGNTIFIQGKKIPIGRVYKASLKKKLKL
ncbi:response regulator transcription factor [Flavobacteriaceae bacterium TP-CH-4]|uniref:Response regulator transcription factor n=1 Tax=Pelagihabitans pacificus TaxID=2696054 RepID=A0A967E6A2_9FLAO|nr:LytTR family DNA-binding domain-containing protein [Pelagihabitans pacificus]NHF60287.1 response regulator transcription factor [Pelagihabitans pacificus]